MYNILFKITKHDIKGQFSYFNVHNLFSFDKQKALDKFEMNGVSIMTSKNKKITSENIVCGNREVTLDLLWNISAHNEILSKIKPEQLREEIDFLRKNLKIKKEIEKVQNKKEYKVHECF